LTRIRSPTWRVGSMDRLGIRTCGTVHGRGAHDGGAHDGDVRGGGAHHDGGVPDRAVHGGGFPRGRLL
ncbi:hypothetical protein AB0B81_33690, partial [Streptomyces sp. NPDC039028]